jgi:hypothetical protein
MRRQLRQHAHRPAKLRRLWGSVSAQRYLRVRGLHLRPRRVRNEWRHMLPGNGSEAHCLSLYRRY